jgi:hypothetical protein
MLKARFIGATLLLLGLVGFAGYRLHVKLQDLPPLPPPFSVTDSGKETRLIFHKALSHEEKERVFDGEFSIVRSTNDLPRSVKRAFEIITEVEPFALANPGTEYQATDVIENPGLPTRRLLFAGVSGSKWFVHYEHGGLGHHCAVVVFEIEHRDRMHFLWGGHSFRGADDIEELRRMVSAGEFRDSEYW